VSFLSDREFKEKLGSDPDCFGLSRGLLALSSFFGGDLSIAEQLSLQSGIHVFEDEPRVFARGDIHMSYRT